MAPEGSVPGSFSGGAKPPGAATTNNLIFFYMKRLFILTAFLTALVGCQSVDSNVMDPSSEAHGRESLKAIEFSIKDTSATKSPTPITSLSEFNVTATSGSAGKEVAKIDNVVFADKNKSGVFRGDALWPTSDPGYHFYASNVAMTHTAFGQTVTISSIDKDVVCAYLQSPGYKVKNDLMFNHILARVGTVSFMNLSLCTDVKLSMKYSGSGTYNLLTGLWSGLGSRSTKELTAADNDFWIIPGTYDATLTYVDANGTPQSKTISQEFKAGLVNNITAKLDGNVIVKTEDVYSEPTFELGSISDVPASGGDSDKPSVTNVGQQKRLKTTFADGREEYDEWEPVNSPDYTIQYGKTLSALTDVCPTYHGDNLGTTTKARTKLGDIYVRVKIGDEITDKTLEVYQEANEETLGDLSIKSFSYSPKVGAAGGTASPTVTYELPYSWTSGASGKYTTNATLSYTTVTDNADATLDKSTGVVTWAANTGNERSEKERVTVSLKGKESKTDATSTQSGDSVDHYGDPTVELTYSGTPIAYNSTSAISPTLVVKQTVYYASGASDPKTLSASEYTVDSYSGSVAGLSVNSSTGVVTPTDNTGSTIAAKTVYDDPTVTFSYSPASHPASGGNSSPSVSYSQTGTYYAEGRNSTDSRPTTVTVKVTAHSKQGTATAAVSQDGDGGKAQATSAITPVTTGATSITYEKVSGDTGMNLDASTGKVSSTANGSASTRSITVKATVIVNEKPGSKTATVSQSGSTITYSISVNPTSLTFAYDASGSGSKKTATVTCPEGDWEVSSTSSGWTATKNGNNVEIYPNAANTSTTTEKTGTVTVCCTGDETKTATVSLTQSKKSVTYSISVNPTSLTFATAASGSGSKKTATVTCSEGDWKVSSTPSGWTAKKNGTTVEIYPNAANVHTTTEKKGTVTVCCTGDETMKANISVTQEADQQTGSSTETDIDTKSVPSDSDYWVKINGETSSSVPVTAAAGSVTVNVTAGHTHKVQPQKRTRTGTKYTWKVGDPTYDWGDWSGWSNNGDPTVTYPSDTPSLKSDDSWLKTSGSYEENKNTLSRSATITATNGGAKATLTVNQDGKAITYSISVNPTSLTFAHDASGLGSKQTVEVNCPEGDWEVVTPTPSGWTATKSGNTVVIYPNAANTSTTTEKTGTVTVRCTEDHNKTAPVSLTQSKKPDEYDIDVD